MKKATTSINALASVSSMSEMKDVAWEEVKKSFESFCLMAGVDSLMKMFEEDAEEIWGPRYGRGAGKRGHRWGTTRGKVGFHGGTIDVDRPRVRDRKGKEIPLPSWEAARDAGFLKQWAMNLTLMNVAMHKFGRAVRLPDAAVPSGGSSGLSKSAVSRRFVALTQQKLIDWITSDLSKLDLVVLQIDGMHLDENLLMIGAVGIDINGDKHPLGVMEGATENAKVVQALLDNLIERGLDPNICRLFVVDGAKALSKASRSTFGAEIPIQRCQVHKARNILDRLPPEHPGAIIVAEASGVSELGNEYLCRKAEVTELKMMGLVMRYTLNASGVAIKVDTLNKPSNKRWEIGAEVKFQVDSSDVVVLNDR